jgi:bifunctional non-homologous end joining protein LigD
MARLGDNKKGAIVEMSDERTSTHAGRELVVRNLNKVFWPDDGLTKGDLIAYYEALAPTGVPHLHSRHSP